MPRPTKAGGSPAPSSPSREPRTHRQPFDDHLPERQDFDLAGFSKYFLRPGGTGHGGHNTAAASGSGAVFQIVLGDAEGFGDHFWTANRTWTDIFKTADGSTSLSQSWSAIFSTFSYTNGTSTLTPVNGSFTWTHGGNTLSWSAVPEPSAAPTGFLIAAGLLRRRRTAPVPAK